MMLSRVLFPAPDGPTMARKSPRLTRRFTSRIPDVSSKSRCTPCSSSRGTVEARWSTSGGCLSPLWGRGLGDQNTVARLECSVLNSRLAVAGSQNGNADAFLVATVQTQDVVAVRIASYRGEGDG